MRGVVAARVFTPLITGVLCCVALSACSRKPEFKAFKPSECPLTVQMPAGQERRTRDYPELRGGSITATIYESRFDDVLYSVSCVVLPAEVSAALRRTSQRELHERSARQAAAQVDGWLIDESSLVVKRKVGHDMAGYKAVIVHAGNAKRTVVGYFVSGSYYVLLEASYPHPPAYNQELYAQRFVDSMAMD
ncbi:MAG: hypothetical protein QM776_14065 [Rhodocyclaceae bacterium]